MERVHSKYCCIFFNLKQSVSVCNFQIGMYGAVCVESRVRFEKSFVGFVECAAVKEVIALATLLD